MARPHGYLAILAAAMAWSTMGIFGKLAFEYDISPENLSALRLVFSFSALFIPLLLFRRDLLRIRKEDIPLFIVLGAFLTGFARVVYFYAIDLTTVTMAVILFYTYPVFITLYVTLIKKERVSLRTACAIILSLAGVALVVKAYEPSWIRASIVGIACGLLSSLIFAIYFFLTRRLRERYTNWTLILYGDGIGMIVLSYFIFSSLPEIRAYPLRLWFLIFAVACLSSLLGYLFYSYAVKHVDPTRGSTLALTEPLFASLLSVVFLGERLEFFQMVGMTLTLFGIGMLFFKKE